MGREANCDCRWGDREGRVTALLESNELIVRGAIRARTDLRALEQVNARDDRLEFTVAGKQISLALGAARARSWAQAIIAGPPTLARKLGVTAETWLYVHGTIDDDALKAAVSGAKEVNVALDEADLAIVRTDDGVALERWIDGLVSEQRVPPIWVVFAKGRGAALGENAVREPMRRAGYIDLKVAGVSEQLSALKFGKRRS
jgi:hypothetical protein